MSSPPRLRVIGLAAGLAAVALAAGFFLLTRGQESSSAATAHTVVPLSKRSQTHVTRRAAAKRTPAVHKRSVKLVPQAPAAKDGLPALLAAALSRNRVVVVSLFAPKLELDYMAMREARAGAAAVGAGFVALDVLSEAQSRPLTRQLGVLEDPAVLVFRRPGELVVRFSGFADRQTIAQAARNAGL